MMLPDTTRRAQARAEAEDAMLPDDARVSSLSDALGAAAIFACLFGVGVVVHEALVLAGWL